VSAQGAATTADRMTETQERVADGTSGDIPWD
jgi:hypothetical protein